MHPDPPRGYLRRAFIRTPLRQILDPPQIVDVCGDPCKTEAKEEDEAQFNKMKEQLTNEPRYILYDFGFMMKDGRNVNKLAFIFW